jgi:hypothetical protein
MANSNAIATLTIQDQDLVSPGFANLVQRIAASVTFPSSNVITYSGYYALTPAAGLFGLYGSGTVPLPFAYIRNLNPINGSGLDIQVKGGGVGTAILGLAPGAMFLYANPLTPPDSGILNLSIECSTGNVLVEYLYAY